MKYGFEREFFVKKRGEFVLAPSGLPMDDCQYLAESRSTPAHDPLDAAFLLLGADHRLKTQAQTHKVQLAFQSTAYLSRDFLRTALRRGGKRPAPLGQGNMYGYEVPIVTDDDGKELCRAAVHVHFSDEQKVKDSNGRTLQTVPRIIDMPKIIHALDEEFAHEIEAASRVKGQYEMKPHGFEYRSLPATIDVVKVAEFLKTL